MSEVNKLPCALRGSTTSSKPLLDGMNDYFFIVHLFAGDPWILASLTSAAAEYTQTIQNIYIFQFKLDIRSDFNIVGTV